jgi:hypothetical protein
MPTYSRFLVVISVILLLQSLPLAFLFQSYFSNDYHQAFAITGHSMPADSSSDNAAAQLFLNNTEAALQEGNISEAFYPLMLLVVLGLTDTSEMKKIEPLLNETIDAMVIGDVSKASDTITKVNDEFQLILQNSTNMTQTQTTP